MTVKATLHGLLASMRPSVSPTNQRVELEKPILVCCHHKVGTVLLSKIFSQLCIQNGWRFEKCLGMHKLSAVTADVVLSCHSLIEFDKPSLDFQGFHFRRDPRDVVVSGYLHHLRTDEEWCTTVHRDYNPPALFPEVPYSRAHLSEEWKKEYVRSLRGDSYQERLRRLTQEEGLIFEMNHYGKWTIEDMASWRPRTDTIEVRFEDAMERYAETWGHIFERCGLSDKRLTQALEISNRHDLGQMSDTRIESMKHVHGRSSRKWEKYFTARLRQIFERRLGYALRALEYERDESWVDG